MINPEYKTKWRPTSDLSGRHNLNPDLLPLEVYMPKNRADAVAFVGELALPEIVAYDGHACQAEMIVEEAAHRWPELFMNHVLKEVSHV